MLLNDDFEDFCVNDRNDDNFDQLLREHFSRELDGQLGRKIAPIKRSRPTRLLIGATVALAASIAGIVLLRPAREPGKTQTVPASGASPVNYQMAWQTTDTGTVYVNDAPMRSMRSLKIESVKWVDPATNATIELTIPHDETILIALNAN